MTQSEEVIKAIAAIKKLDPKWEGGAPIGGEVNARYTSPDGINVSIWFWSMCPCSAPYCCHIKIDPGGETIYYERLSKRDEGYRFVREYVEQLAPILRENYRRKEEDRKRHSQKLRDDFLNR